MAKRTGHDDLLQGREDAKHAMIMFPHLRVFASSWCSIPGLARRAALLLESQRLGDNVQRAAVVLDLRSILAVEGGAAVADDRVARAHDNAGARVAERERPSPPFEDIVRLEQHYGVIEPYRSLARYQLYHCRRA